MVIPNPMVKGGIAAVVNGYHESQLERDYKIIYVESYKDGKKVTKLLKAIRGYLHFVKVLIVDKPDLIHIHSSFDASFYRKILFIYMANWAKKPIVNHIHGAEFEKFFLNKSKKKQNLIKRVYGKCDILIALSEEWKEKLGQIVPAEKIKIIENYSVVNETAFNGRLKRACNNIVLFLGELGTRKGCFDIPDIAEKVATEIIDVKFILAGEGALDDKESLERKFADRGLEKNVQFPGWIRDKEKDEILRQADIFFLPSYNEGMPMSVLDAMGYGIPVVSTNIGGIPKIVCDGENGFCCVPGDIMAMAEDIVRILVDKNLRLKMSKESYRIAKEKYSLKVHIKELEKVYESFTLEEIS